MRPLGRVVSGVLAVMVLLVPSAQARADNDPEPVTWPKIDQPDTGDQSDPAPVSWPKVLPAE
ncbi:hypothetical protein OG558_10695 [Kribbella sp. NBC_01510]|uniref:hypothetical protein n=1 Tax=unclassified Kribbella TaxID=2644121 RepID=UPI002E33C020|nr:hypothetical protein [Kribbella sp. NBC_01484]